MTVLPSQKEYCRSPRLASSGVKMGLSPSGFTAAKIDLSPFRRCFAFLALTLPLFGGPVPKEEPLPASFLPPPVAASVQQGWESNLTLSQRQLDIELAGSRLAEVRASLQPQVDLLGRYTRADGGRTIDLPLGDLLNGAYATLNDYLLGQGRSPAFPSVSNQSISLVQRESQETKLRLTQVLWRPELSRLVRASRHVVEAQRAQVLAYRRELAHLVTSAHLEAWAAENAVGIWRGATEVLTEAVRVDEALFAHEKITEDVLLRARAEALAVRESLLGAERDARAARMRLNFLLNRDLATPVPAPAGVESCIGILDTWRSRPALGQREELLALEAAIAAAAAQEAAASGRRQPSLALVVESGIQGESYRTDDRGRFVQGSLVAEVNVWDGGARGQKVAQAKIAHRQLQLQRDQLQLQLELQLEHAWDDFVTARASLETALLRDEAARRALDVVTRRERAGMANALAFLDARQEQTAAALQAAVARYRVIIAASALDLAAGDNPNH